MAYLIPSRAAPDNVEITAKSKARIPMIGDRLVSVTATMTATSVAGLHPSSPGPERAAGLIKGNEAS